MGGLGTRPPPGTKSTRCGGVEGGLKTKTAPVGLVAGPPGSVALLLFLHPPPGRWAGNPQRSLAGFERMAVPGPATVAFPVTAHQLAVAAPATGRLEVLPGTWVATLEDQSCQFRVE